MNPTDNTLDELATEIIDHAGLLARTRHHLLVLVGEFDASAQWARFGALSCAAWLANVCELDRATAHCWVRVARSMRAHPRLAAALADGTLSYAKARVLVAHLSDTNADELLALAITTPSGGLAAAIAGWSRRHEDPEAIDRRHHRDRSTRWRTDSDGMITITTRLPPHRAAGIIAAIDRKVMTASAPAGATLAQQRADVHHHLLTTPGGSTGVGAEIVIHVDQTGTHLPDGTPLSDHGVAAMFDDAFISLLIHDADAKPIDASPRRRNPTRRQRRVLDARHPACCHPGCHATELLQYDHITPRNQGGPTIVDNLQRLCGPHNRAKGGDPDNRSGRPPAPA
jgi:hypothetical protein